MTKTSWILILLLVVASQAAGGGAENWKQEVDAAEQAFLALRSHEALRHLEQGLRLARQDDAGAVAIGYILEQLAVAYRNTGDLERQRELLQEALELKRRELGTEHPAVADTLEHIALLDTTDDLEKSERLLLEAHRLRREGLPPDHPRLAESLTYLGTTRETVGDDEQALAYYLEAIAVLDRAGVENPTLLGSLAGAIPLLEKQGRAAEAEELQRRFRQTADGPAGDAFPGPPPPWEQPFPADMPPKGGGGE